MQGADSDLHAAGSCRGLVCMCNRFQGPFEAFCPSSLNDALQQVVAEGVSIWMVVVGDLPLLNSLHRTFPLRKSLQDRRLHLLALESFAACADHVCVGSVGVARVDVLAEDVGSYLDHTETCRSSVILRMMNPRIFHRAHVGLRMSWSSSRVDCPGKTRRA